MKCPNCGATGRDITADEEFSGATIIGCRRVLNPPWRSIWVCSYNSMQPTGAVCDPGTWATGRSCCLGCEHPAKRICGQCGFDSLRPVEPKQTKGNEHDPT